MAHQGQTIFNPRTGQRMEFLEISEKEQVSREVAEGFVVQVGQQEFAHGPHHEEQHEADDHVDEDDGRAG